MTQEPQNLDISKLENVERPSPKEKSKTYNLLLDVELELSAILGETDISLKKVLDITKGSIIDLDNKTAEPIKLLANGSEVARGEVVIIEDNFGLRITDITQKEVTKEQEDKPSEENEAPEEEVPTEETNQETEEEIKKETEE